MTNIGIDIGSTYTKYCILNTDDAILSLFSERTPVRQREYFSDKLIELSHLYPDACMVSCGYGKRNIGTEKSVSELSALAVGVDCQCPGINVVLDIGGQDTKVIKQHRGRLQEFFINDKCAAGSGMFLTNVLNLLSVTFDDIDLSVVNEDIKLSTTCAVFAQSEIVELIADNVSEKEIIKATLHQIFTQAALLLNKLNCGDKIALSGGLTQINGIKAFAERLLNRSVLIPANAPYLSALGCAKIAKEART